MVVLLAVSIISLTLIGERILFWISMHRGRRIKKLGRLVDALRTGNRAVAEGLVKNDNTAYGNLARRLLDIGATEAVAVEAVENQRPRIDRFMTSLSTIVTAAPLLGILGTVVGIIQSFDIIGKQTTLEDPRVVSAGIATALLTTALGLIVALMTLFPFMIFRVQVERSIGRMESLIAAAQQGADVATQSSTRKSSSNVGGKSSGSSASSSVRSEVEIGA